MEFPGWDPVLLEIPGLPIAIRFYGLMYVVGLVCAQWILVRLARRGFLGVSPATAPDLIFYCVFGVMLGGRTGYALFYEHDLLSPIEFVKVWKGGLSFHGGLAGVGIACWVFSRRHRLSFRRVGDALALAVTPGVFAVRMANFVNGELYGRVTAAGSFLAMQFPTDPKALAAMHLDEGMSMRDRELCLQVAMGRRTWESIADRLAATDDAGRRIPWTQVREHLDWKGVKAMTAIDPDTHQAVPLVPFRYASQILEGCGEGLLLGLVLLLAWLLTRHRPLARGRYAAIFVLGYAVVRFSLEFVRQPDRQFTKPGDPIGLPFLGLLTMGQTLSAAMLVLGFALLVWPQRATAPVDGAAGAP